MTYIVMNNGCYGLTKGQFSATNDKTSPSKKGEENPFDAIDLCQMAIQLGAGFVARSFSGDKRQLMPLIKSAISYKGFALPRRHQPVRDVQQPSDVDQELRIRARAQPGDRQARLTCEEKEEITAEYEEGTSVAVAMHDGSTAGPAQAQRQPRPARRRCGDHDNPQECGEGQVATGLLYINEQQHDLHDVLGDRRAAAQRDADGRALPRLEGAGRDQRAAAVAL